MEFKGTKGKRVVTRDGLSVYNDISDDPMRNLPIANCGNRFELFSEYVVKANALLISKAPEMLECLKGLSDAISTGNGAKLSQYNLKSKQLIKEATSI